MGAPRRSWWVGALAAALGCAGPAVRPADLPPMPRPDGAMRVRVVLDAAPPAMGDEARLIARGLPGWREEALAQGAAHSRLRRHQRGCDPPAARAEPVRVKCRRAEPALHLRDIGGGRDSCHVDLSGRVAVVRETTVEGRLETVACDGSRAPNTLVESLRLRSEGRGLIRSARLKSEQTEGAVRGLTRKLLGAAIAEAAGTQGGR